MFAKLHFTKSFQFSPAPTEIYIDSSFSSMISIPLISIFNIGLVILFLNKIFDPPPRIRGLLSFSVMKSKISSSLFALLKLVAVTSIPKVLYSFSEVI